MRKMYKPAPVFPPVAAVACESGLRGLLPKLISRAASGFVLLISHLENEQIAGERSN